MKKKIITAVSTLALISLLAGCFPSGKKPAADDTESGNVDVGTGSVDAESNSGGADVNPNENSVPSDGGELRSIPLPENFAWDMELSYDTPAAVQSVRLTLKKWDKEELERLLLDGKEITNQSDSDLKFSDEELYWYETGDQMNIYFEPGRIGIDDKDALGGKFKYGSVYFKADVYTASDEELSAFSREDAVNRVNSFMDKLGITNYGEPLITPIKADFANEVLASFRGDKDKQGKEFEYTPWTADEEIYVLIYPFVFENTELAMHGFLIPQSSDKATHEPRVIAVVTKDKIISFSAESIYTADYEKVESVPVKYDFSSAVKDMVKFYSNLWLGWPVTYYSGKLVYIPREMTDDGMTVTFVPGWEFLGYSEVWERPAPFNRSSQYEYFYADTGTRYIEE